MDIMKQSLFCRGPYKAMRWLQTVLTAHTHTHRGPFNVITPLDLDVAKSVCPDKSISCVSSIAPLKQKYKLAVCWQFEVKIYMGDVQLTPMLQIFKYTHSSNFLTCKWVIGGNRMRSSLQLCLGFVEMPGLQCFPTFVLNLAVCV